MRFQRLVQIALFVLFALLLWQAKYPLAEGLPVDLFLRLDPTILLGTMLVSGTWITDLFRGLAVLLLALVLGRFFCGYVCPLGATVDAADWMIRRKKPGRNGNAAEGNTRIQAWKYLLLFAVFCSVLAGVSLVFLVSPISLATRFYTVTVYPVLLSLADSCLWFVENISSYLGLDGAGYLQIKHVSFNANVFTAFFVTGLLLLGLLRPRFWCRNVCPAGAMFALCSRKPMVRRTVNDRCTDCGACIRSCPMGAISNEPQRTAHSECIVCLKCMEVCPENAVSFRWTFEKNAAPAVDPGKRRLVLSGCAGLAAGLLLKTNVGSVQGSAKDLVISRVRILRPPGALPEEAFLDRCVRCGECMKACPTNTLQPVWFETGIDGVWSPKLAARYAACEQACNLCGRVCPTGAVRPLSLDEKKYAKIGTAFIDRSRCIAWEEDRACLICDEICPYNAIVMRPVTDNRNTVPFVNENKCNGCGYCENKCPVLGEAAIRVSPHGELRLFDGSYERTAQAHGLVFHAKGGLEESFSFTKPKQDGNTSPEIPPVPSPDQLPPGFTSD
ncbi:MAG: 4Fe-4S binding protein [Deltaproteobacteria bacterium]|nr:4Fe-4S binding protein [Deltaproteobacteria bacterium]